SPATRRSRRRRLDEAAGAAPAAIAASAASSRSVAHGEANSTDGRQALLAMSPSRCRGRPLKAPLWPVIAYVHAASLAPNWRESATKPLNRPNAQHGPRESQAEGRRLRNALHEGCVIGAWMSSFLYSFDDEKAGRFQCRLSVQR